MLAGEIDAAANCAYIVVVAVVVPCTLSLARSPVLCSGIKESQKLITIKSCTLVMRTWQPVLPRTSIILPRYALAAQLAAMYYYDDPTTGPATATPACAAINDNARMRGYNGPGVAGADRAVNQKASAWISRSGP